MSSFDWALVNLFALTFLRGIYLFILGAKLKLTFGQDKQAFVKLMRGWISKIKYVESGEGGEKGKMGKLKLRGRLLLKGQLEVGK